MAHVQMCHTAQWVMARAHIWMSDKTCAKKRMGGELSLLPDALRLGVLDYCELWIVGGSGNRYKGVKQPINFQKNFRSSKHSLREAEWFLCPSESWILGTSRIQKSPDPVFYKCFKFKTRLAARPNQWFMFSYSSIPANRNWQIETADWNLDVRLDIETLCMPRNVA